MAGRKVLTSGFFRREGTAEIARDLLGKILVTELMGIRTEGIITETEAYLGAEDKACHAFNYRRTKRTETMYLPGGHAYVYLCYGIHHLFNIVTHKKDEPHAVLIRAVEPILGIEEILIRRKKEKVLPQLTAGPGAMSQAMGIQTNHDSMPLQKGGIWVEDRGLIPEIQTGTRIGVDYAGEHAKWPLRFWVSGNRFVSKPS